MAKTLKKISKRIFDNIERGSLIIEDRGSKSFGTNETVIALRSNKNNRIYYYSTWRQWTEALEEF